MISQREFIDKLHQIIFLNVYFNIKFYSRSDNIKWVKKNKEKYGKIENIFLRRWVWISVRCSHIFLQVLKLPINSYFYPSKRIILSR